MRRRHAILRSCILGTLFTLSGSACLSAAELAEVEQLYRTGEYDACARQAGEALAKGASDESWWRLKVRAEAATGKFDEALTSLKGALKQHPRSLSLHFLAVQVSRQAGKEKEAALASAALEEQVLRLEGRDLTPSERIALGKYLLSHGVDARKVLDQFYTSTRKNHPDFLGTSFAMAELAIQKHDNALAAETLFKAPKKAAEDPHYHYLLARAYAGNDRARAAKALDEALRINPRHVESLLLRADQLVDREDYDDAEAALKKVLAIDPQEPRAWAYQAVLAHLRGDAKGESACREKALARWPRNPEVDHLIGRKLSQDYRFAEGAGYQRKALSFDKDYLPAKVQLCQDLLRLGKEEEGWKLAEAVFAEDGYNVLTYNLVTLRDELKKYRALHAEGFLLRMEAREADLYGKRALAVLSRARETLCKKYGVKLNRTITVEIFPRQQDFAVRTFGLPGADGFLGVCFGPVITAISPAPQGENPSNWEAVLWHEFCHTVTLTKTRNRMPRWLSEGISVYEEKQENPAWGQWLNPHYREMILGEELTPLSQLSSAFLAPKSGLHLSFAYFESALAVEFLVERYGADTLNRLLDDLGAGLPIAEALARRTTALKRLDADFAEFARERARSVAPRATWERPDLPADSPSKAVEEWLKEHPDSFWGLQRLADGQVAEKEWARAEKTLTHLVELYPEYIGAGNAYASLAVVYRATSRPAEERAILEKWAEQDGDAMLAYLRLIALCEEAKDWPAMARNTRRLLAVNPLIEAPHRALARAAEQLKEREAALDAYGALLRLGDPDLAHLHYRRAVLLHADGKAKEARREVLKALEEAPRFLEAHQLLLELVEPRRSETKP